MSGQHCESHDVKRETVHCYPVNSSLCTAVARNGWNLSAVFKFCFCFVLLYNKSLNDWSLGEQWILFPSNLNVSLDFVSGKIHCPPRDQSLSVYCSPLNFLQRSSSKTILNYFYLFQMKAVKVKCKIWRRKQTKTHLIQLQVFFFFSPLVCRKVFTNDDYFPRTGTNGRVSLSGWTLSRHVINLNQ